MNPSGPDAFARIPTKRRKIFDDGVVKIIATIPVVRQRRLAAALRTRATCHMLRRAAEIAGPAADVAEGALRGRERMMFERLWHSLSSQGK